VAMLITPGATAYLLTDRFGTMLWLSSGMGVATSLAGAYASYYFDGATGGCIVTLQTLVFLAAGCAWRPLVVSPLLRTAARRRRRDDTAPESLVPHHAERATKICPVCGLPFQRPAT